MEWRGQECMLGGIGQVLAAVGPDCTSGWDSCWALIKNREADSQVWRASLGKRSREEAAVRQEEETIDGGWRRAQALPPTSPGILGKPHHLSGTRFLLL